MINLHTHIKELLTLLDQSLECTTFDCMVVGSIPILGEKYKVCKEEHSITIMNHHESNHTYKILSDAIYCKIILSQTLL